MLVVVLSINGYPMEKELHMGNPDGLKMSDQVLEQVFCVQADGDELQAIYSQFEGLPSGGNRVMKWFGDHAKFIVGNLKL